MFVSALLIGLVTGSLVGTLGIGAGALMVPSLMFFTGLTIQKSIAITLAMQTLPVGIVGAYIYYKDGLLDLKIAAYVAIGMLVGIVAGAWGATKHFNLAILEKAFGVVLILFGVFTLFYKRKLI